MRPSTWSLLSHSLSWLSSGLLTHLSLCANMVFSLLSPSFSFLSLRSDLFETEWRALSHFAGNFFRLRRPPTTEILRHRLIYSYSCLYHTREEEGRGSLCDLSCRNAAEAEEGGPSFFVAQRRRRKGRRKEGGERGKEKRKRETELQRNKNYPLQDLTCSLQFTKPSSYF